MSDDLLQVMFPAGFSPSCRILRMPSGCRVKELLDACAGLMAARPNSGSDMDEYMALAKTNDDFLWLDADKLISSYSLTLNETVILTRRYETCYITHSRNKEVRVLLDFMSPLVEVMPYVRRVLGLDLVPETEFYVRSNRKNRPLLMDVSLRQQGITPVSEFYVRDVTEPPQWVSTFKSGLSRHEHGSLDYAEDANVEALLEITPSAQPRAAFQTAMLRMDRKGRWKKCYVVQDGAYLFVYRDGKEEGAMLVVPLRRIKMGVLEEIAKQKHVLVIAIPRNAAGERSSDRLCLAMRSEGELDKWHTTLRLAAYPPKTATFKANIFGKPVAAAVTEVNGSELPAVVVHCLIYLDREEIMKTKGLFRLSGAASQIDSLRAFFNEGHVPDLSRVQDPHAVAGLLKQYFREMVDSNVDPLMTWDAYDALVNTLLVEDLYARIHYLKYIVTKQIPPLNYAILKTLMLFLKRVSQYEKDNKMPLHNLATVFAPNILHRKDSTSVDVLEASTIVNPVVVTLCHYAEFIFEDEATNVPSGDLPVANAYAEFAATDPVLDLPLAPGDLVEVGLQGDPDGWWIGSTADGRFGRFPGSFVQLLPEKDAKRERMKRKIAASLSALRSDVSKGADRVAQRQREVDFARERLAHMERCEGEWCGAGFPDGFAALLEANKHFVPTLRHYQDECQKSVALLRGTEAVKASFAAAMRAFFDQIALDQDVSKRIKRKLAKADNKSGIAAEATKRCEKANGGVRARALEARANILVDVDRLSRILCPGESGEEAAASVSIGSVRADSVQHG